MTRERLGESNAILRYLAERENRDDLFPSHPAARARVDWALDTWSIQIRPRLLALEVAALLYRDEEGGGGAPEEADQGLVAAALDPARDALAELEAFIGPDGHMVDGGFSLADRAAAPALWRSQRLPLDFDPWPRVQRLRDATTSRPAFKAAGPVA